MKPITVSAKVAISDMKKIDSAVSNGDYLNRSDFIRSAIREKIAREVA